MSEGYAAALGELIAEFCEDVPEDCSGLMIVTHNREIATAIAKTSAWRVRIGDDLRSTEEWLRDGPLSVSREKLESLGNYGTKKYQQIARLMDSRRAEQKEAEARREQMLLDRKAEAREAYLISAKDPNLTEAERRPIALTYVLTALNYFAEKSQWGKDKIAFKHAVESDALLVNGTEIGSIEILFSGSGQRTVARIKIDGQRYDATENGLEDAARKTRDMLGAAKKALESEAAGSRPSR